MDELDVQPNDLTNMVTELIEDETARRYRILRSQQLCNELCRACLLYGCGICIPVAAVIYSIPWFYSLPLERSDAAIVAALSPLILSATFFLLPFIHSLFRNRWRITSEGIRLRGEHFGKISWAHLVQWRKERMSDLPGYYVVSVRGRYTGTTEIILLEDRWPWDLLTGLIPRTLTTKGEH